MIIDRPRLRYPVGWLSFNLAWSTTLKFAKRIPPLLVLAGRLLTLCGHVLWVLEVFSSANQLQVREGSRLIWLLHDNLQLPVGRTSSIDIDSIIGRVPRID
jgi:hypothetical protein